MKSYVFTWDILFPLTRVIAYKLSHFLQIEGIDCESGQGRGRSCTIFDSAIQLTVHAKPLSSSINKSIVNIMYNPTQQNNKQLLIGSHNWTA